MSVAIAVPSGMLVGVFGWTLAEYVIHRWLQHTLRRGLASREHGRHHRDNTYRYKRWVGWLVILGLGSMAALAGAVSQVAACSYAGAGFIVAYGAHEWLHARAHSAAPRGSYERWLRRYHFAHHYVDDSTNFGVTTPIWDWVFRTGADREPVTVPRDRAMDWLTDASGELRSEFASDYVLV
jgi:sterol desaturase/sphingolipid hydroxylase (fatty acid hydroxylase superfamily)